MNTLIKKCTVGLSALCLLFVLAGASGCAAMASKPVTRQSPETDAAKANELVNNAEAAIRAGDENKALMEYVAALQFATESTDIRYRIAVLQERRGDTAAALQAFRDVLNTQPDHAGALEGAGLAMLKTRQLPQARAYLERAVAIDVTRWRAYNGLGVLADLRRESDLAAENYSAALKLQPTQSMLHNNLGYSRYLAGDYQGAIIHFERALAANSDNKTAWANMGLVSARLGDARGSVEAFTEIMEPYRAHNNVGYLFYMNGNYSVARSHLEQAIALSPAYYTMAQQNLQRLDVVTAE